MLGSEDDENSEEANTKKGKLKAELQADKLKQVLFLGVYIILYVYALPSLCNIVIPVCFPGFWIIVRRKYFTNILLYNVCPLSISRNSGVRKKKMLSERNIKQFAG